VGVASREIILWSSARWSAASKVAMDLAISLLALATALSTPCRDISIGQRLGARGLRVSPVEAPEGTAGAAKRSAIKNDVGFDSGIAAGINDLAGTYLTILVDMMVCSPEWMRINDFTEECHGVTEAWRMS